MKHPTIIVVALLVPSVRGFFCDSNNVGQRISAKGDRKTERNIAIADESETATEPSRPLAEDNNSNQNGDDNGNKDNDLVFEGTFRSTSDVVLPIPADTDSLYDFFADPSHRDLAIKGGGNPCDKIALTPDRYQQWTAQSRIVESTPPSSASAAAEEEILAVHSEVPIVPGLSLRAVSYTGCKTMKEPTSALPFYEFTLLEESYRPVGTKGLTRIFNGVTGIKKSKRKQKQKRRRDGGRRPEDDQTHTDNEEPTAGSGRGGGNRKTYALSRVGLEPTTNGGCQISYYGHVRLTLSGRMLYLLPLPTKLVRSIVNKSIRKQLERECTRSMEKFSGALQEWQETKRKLAR